MKLRIVVQSLLAIAATVMARADIADLMALARDGDSQAQYLLGCAWIHGDIDGSSDLGEAMICLRQSSEQDYAPAQGLLGFLLLEKASDEEGFKEAVAFLSGAADGGCPLGMTGLGLASLNGWGVDRDPEAAFEYFKQAAEKDEPLGQFGYSQVLEYGVGSAADLAEANRWLETASQHRFDPAETDLGLHCWHGTGQEADPISALIHLNNTADAGYAPAQFHFAALIWSGDALRPDQAKAIKWLQKSARNGYAPSLRALGILNAKGIGLGQNIAQAQAYLKEASELGDEQASLALADRIWESDTDSLPDDVWQAPELPDRILFVRGDTPGNDIDAVVEYLVARELLVARY